MTEYVTKAAFEKLELSLIPTIRQEGTFYHVHLNGKSIIHASSLGISLRAFTGLVSHFKAYGWEIEREDVYNNEGRHFVLTKQTWDGLEEYERPNLGPNALN